MKSKAELGALIDVNLSWGVWPFRRMPGDTSETLLAKLRQHGVSQAWIGPFEGLFHRDLRSVNERFVAECRRVAPDLLLPCGAINPLLPDWQEDLRRCHETHRLRIIRLYPGYHGYDLKRPEFAELLDAATERHLVVQIVGAMEDERTQPALARAPHVDLKPLVELLRTRPRVRVVLLNAFRNTSLDVAASIAAAGSAWFEIAMLESVGGVRKAFDKLPADRVLFGSHFPLFYFESAVGKLSESALTPDELARVARDNARRLLEN